MEKVSGRLQRTEAPTVCMTIVSKVCRIPLSRPRFTNHEVGAQHAEVWRSPIS